MTNNDSFNPRSISIRKALLTACVPLSCMFLTACGGSDEKAEVVSTSVQQEQQPVNEAKEQANQAQIEAQKAQIEAQKAQIEAQKAQLEKKQEQIKQVSNKANSTENKKPAKSSNSPKLSMKAESSLAIVKDFFEKGGKTYITVDFVQYIEPSETSVGEIKNVNPKLRTYELTKSEYSSCTGGNMDSVDSLWTEWEALQIEEPLYHVSAKKGKVIDLYLSCAG